jgi:hypothetical protein
MLYRIKEKHMGSLTGIAGERSAVEGVAIKCSEGLCFRRYKQSSPMRQRKTSWLACGSIWFVEEDGIGPPSPPS